MEVGYLNEHGRVEFSVQCECACGPYESCGAVKRKGKVEIISHRGEQVLRTTAVDANGPLFGCFIARVDSLTGEYRRGLLTEDGCWIAPPQFYSLDYWDGHYFSGQLEMFGRCNLYNLSGSLVLESYAQVSSPVSEGLVTAGLPNDKKGRQGFRKLDGDWQIKPKFDSATPFIEGRSFVTEGLGKARRAGIIDRDGKWVHQFPKKVKDFCEEFSEGVIGVYQGETSGLMNLNGDLLCEGEWNPMDGKVIGGVIPALKFKGKKYGLMDTQGNWRIEPEFETVVTQVGPFVAFRRELLGLEEIVVVNTSGKILWDGTAAL